MGWQPGCLISEKEPLAKNDSAAIADPLPHGTDSKGVSAGTVRPAAWDFFETTGAVRKRAPPPIRPDASSSHVRMTASLA